MGMSLYTPHPYVNCPRAREPPHREMVRGTTDAPFCMTIAEGALRPATRITRP